MNSNTKSNECSKCGRSVKEQGMFLLCICGKTQHNCECEKNGKY